MDMRDAYRAYINGILRSFGFGLGPTRLNPLDVMQCHTWLVAVVEPTLWVAGPDARRLDGYHSLLWCWAVLFSAMHGQRLVVALRRSLRRWSRRGLDPVAMAGLLCQIRRRMRDDEEESFRAPALRQAS